MQSTTMKRCTKCGEEKSSGEFHKDKYRPDGLRQYCKACCSIRKPENTLEPCEEGMKRCWDCRKTHPATSEFWFKDATKPDGFFIYCKQCKSKRQARGRVRPVRGEILTKICRKCKREFPAGPPYFRRIVGGVGELGATCKECRSKDNFRFIVDGKKYCRGCKEYHDLADFGRRFDGGVFKPRSRCRKCEEVVGFRRSLPQIVKLCIKYKMKEKYTVEDLMESPVLEGAVRRSLAHHARALKLDLPTDAPPSRLVEQLALQESRCFYCRRPLDLSWHLEHVIPLSRIDITPGNVMSNIVCACQQCNYQKHTRTPEEWSPRWYESEEAS